jgi:SAM-dependent methyltransferase
MQRRNYGHRPPQGRRPGPKSSWEPVSDWYGGYMRQRENVQQTVVFPGALRLLAPKDGGRYLDIACGEGSFTRLLAKAKDVHVVGFDASHSLIQQAKRQAPKRSDYEVFDAVKLQEKYSPASFDGAACILAIQNIDPFEPVFRGAARSLKPGAPFVIVMNHPAFRQLRQSGWGWDEGRKLQYRRVDKYLSAYDVPVQAHPGSAPSVNTISYHRPLSAYVEALAKSGFTVDALEEWISPKSSDSGPKAKAENVARQEIPLFLAIRARKTAA